MKILQMTLLTVRGQDSCHEVLKQGKKWAQHKLTLSGRCSINNQHPSYSMQQCIPDSYAVSQHVQSTFSSIPVMICLQYIRYMYLKREIEISRLSL